VANVLRNGSRVEHEFTYTFFDWVTKEEKYEHVQTLMKERTRDLLGENAIVDFFVRYPRFIVNSEFTSHLSTEMMDLIRDRSLKSLKSETGWNRHNKLGLYNHWRLKRVPTTVPIFLTFHRGNTTYSIPLDERFMSTDARNWFYHSASLEPKSIFKFFDNLVKFYQGKNKEVWTQDILT